MAIINIEPVTRPSEDYLIKQSKDVMFVLSALRSVPLSAALGACIAFMLEVAYAPEEVRRVFRRCLREPVHKNGFVGISVLEVFRRQSE